jgi:hypothetical protein
MSGCQNNTTYWTLCTLPLRMRLLALNRVNQRISDGSLISPGTNGLQDKQRIEL